MKSTCLAKPEVGAFRFAVYACSSKLDLSNSPDPALALFEHRLIAEAFGRMMWPTTYEVVDLLAAA
ncbi:hypothetical protein NLO95_07895 [Pseudomonas syringae]|nr:hypothetical protein [Pseudomonas syringae]